MNVDQILTNGIGKGTPKDEFTVTLMVHVDDVEHFKPIGERLLYAQNPSAQWEFTGPIWRLREVLEDAVWTDVRVEVTDLGSRELPARGADEGVMAHLADAEWKIRRGKP